MTHARILLLAGLALCLTHTCGPARAETTTERALRVACGPGAVYLAPAVDAAARRYLHHPVLLVALIRRESHCRPDAIGAHGEVGLGQLHGRARNGLSRAALRDPATNLMATARWLALMETWAGGTFAGLGAYNTGKKGRGRRYARKVLATMRRIMVTIGKDGKR
jgi:soluble lytic murein transglycosylase-like protein